MTTCETVVAGTIAVDALGCASVGVERNRQRPATDRHAVSNTRNENL